MRFKHTAIIAASLTALALSACTTSTTPVATTAAPAPATSATSKAPVSDPLKKGDGTQTIYLVSKGFQHRFWQAVKQGAEQAGVEYGYKIQFVGPNTEKDVTQQNDQLKTALDSKPAAIGFAALDTKAASSILDQVRAAKIPLIAFDSGVEGNYPLTTVSTDNTAAAGEAAKHLAELIGKKGTVGLICHDQTSMTGEQRCQGFQDWMKTNAPDVKVLTPQVAGEVGAAADVAKSMTQANPDMIGLYGTNEAAATGAVKGLTELKNTTIKIVGFDSGRTQIEAIRAGTQAGAVTQAPVKMGYETVKAAVMAINGATLPAKVDSGFLRLVRQDQHRQQGNRRQPVRVSHVRYPG